MKKEEIHSIGIDVSKKTLDVCFLGDKFTVLQEFKIENSIKGVQKIIRETKKYLIEEEMSFVLEATGTYHVLAALYLKGKGSSVKVFNPILSNKYAKSSVRKNKTDKIDARRIAEIGILETLQEFEMTKEMFFLKKKISLLQTLTKETQVIKASLRQFREDCETLSTDPCKVFLLAEESLKNFQKMIKSLEKEIQAQGEKLKGHAQISEIKGVSEKASAIILSYISDKDFASKYSLTAFAGLDVSVRQSGTSINGRGRISKRGNNMLRNTLAQCAWGLRMHNKSFQKLVEYYQNKGRHYFEIMVILARKLLHIIFGMLKNNSQFDPNKIVIPNS